MSAGEHDPVPEGARPRSIRRGHHRWFIVSGPGDGERAQIRCLCGHLSTGLLAWNEHALAPLDARTETE